MSPGEQSVEEEIPADAVYLLTGYRPTQICSVAPASCSTIVTRRSTIRETFETNVSGLFVAGGAIAGVDTGTIFIENGRFHGEKIIDVIARRL